MLCLSGKDQESKGWVSVLAFNTGLGSKVEHFTVWESEKGDRMLEETFEGLANYYVRSLATVSHARLLLWGVCRELWYSVNPY